VQLDAVDKELELLDQVSHRIDEAVIVGLGD